MPRFIGIDPGDARIGVALSDELAMLAHPLETIPAGPSAVERIVLLAQTHGVEAVVIGLPRNMDGSSGTAAEKARALGAAIKTSVTCPLIFWDERLTTVAAERSLHDAGMNAKKQRKVIDQVAAQMILQSWLDSRPPAH